MLICKIYIFVLNVFLFFIFFPRLTFPFSFLAIFFFFFIDRGHKWHILYCLIDNKYLFKVHAKSTQKKKKPKKNLDLNPKKKKRYQ